MEQSNESCVKYVTIWENQYEDMRLLSEAIQKLTERVEMLEKTHPLDDNLKKQLDGK